MRLGFFDNLSRWVKRKRLEWQDLFIKSYIKFLAILVLFAGGGYLWVEGSDIAGEFLYDRSYRASIALGMGLDGVTVDGVRHVSDSDLRDILVSIEGSSLPFLDIEDLRERLESLGWVRGASVRRIFPNDLRIRIIEHVPAAIWQEGGRHQLITSDGLVISDDISSFGDLPLLVGEGANFRLGDLRMLLGGSDFLREYFRAAVWVSERRWNIHLDGDIIVKLPEAGAFDAWRRLGDLVRDELLLEHGGIAILDMRLGDRLVIRFKDGEGGVYSNTDT